MRKLSIVEFVTLDGVTQGFAGPAPGDEDFTRTGWGLPYADPAASEKAAEAQPRTSAYLLGRRTYQHMAEFWPHQPAENAMAAHLNKTPKYVATRTLTSLDWSNSQRLEGELVPAVRALKESGDRNITVLGSGMLVQQLIGAGLVDAYTLYVHPLILGTGKRLFGELGAPIGLELRDVDRTSTGVLVLDYAVTA